jgi:hypothetical protein
MNFVERLTFAGFAAAFLTGAFFAEGFLVLAFLVVAIPKWTFLHDASAGRSACRHWTVRRGALCRAKFGDVGRWAARRARIYGLGRIVRTQGTTRIITLVFLRG